MAQSPVFLCRVADFILLLFFVLIAVAAPLIDAQTCFPGLFFPQFLVDLKAWYAEEYGDYLISEKPGFFVGVVWMELLLQWPLAMANVYGIVRERWWYPTTCLIYGASTCTGMAAILGELIGSGKASNQVLMMYLPFMGIAFMAILRGLVFYPSSSTHVKTARKKRA